jgi:phosphate transport system substrate-binding protein
MNPRKRLAAFLLLVFCTSSLLAQTRIGGSDTLIYLGQRFAEQYHTKRPDQQFRVVGRRVGASANDDLDVLQIEGSAPSGKRTMFAIAVQSLVVYVNKANPVKELTVAQVRSIFLGNILNWKELGGPDRTITLYAGESTTGNLAFFQDAILHGEEPYPFVGKSNTKALLEVISSDAAAIGYGTIDVNPGVRALSIKAGPTSAAVEPSIPNIRFREYPITRHINWAVSPTASREVKDLCAWVLSSEGQLVTEGAGFQPLLPEERSAGLSRLGIKELGTVAARH